MKPTQCVLLTPVDGSDRLWRLPDGRETTLAEAPIGAMWWADWLTGLHPSQKHLERGNGPHLVVKTPGGDWDIDAPSSNGNGWERTGDPPAITARPSIGFMNHDGTCYRFHGWLTAGVLTEC